MSASSILKGLLVVSLDSGILLFSEPLEKNYGISKNQIDAMQLSSTIFALFKLSCEISFDEDQGHKLRWIRKDDTVILFVENVNSEECSSFLIVLCSHIGIDIKLLRLLGEEISIAFGASNISTLHSPRASTLKTFRDTFVSIMLKHDALVLEAASSVADLDGLCIPSKTSQSKNSRVRKRLADFWMDSESNDAGASSEMTVTLIPQPAEEEAALITATCSTPNIQATELSPRQVGNAVDPDREGLIIHAASDIQFEDHSGRGIFTCCFHRSRVQSLST